MEDKWVVILLVLIWIDDRMLTFPVGLLEGESGADVLDDAAVWREAEGPLELAFDPNRIGEPIDGAVHRMEIYGASPGSAQEPRVQRGWIIDSKLLGGKDAQSRKTTNN